MAALGDEAGVAGGVLQEDVQEVGVRLQQDPLQLFVGVALGDVGQHLGGQQGRSVGQGKIMTYFAL